jgi:mutator protein MutT
MKPEWKPRQGVTYARVGLRAIIKNDRGEILLLKRTAHGSWGNLWDFPGGGLEYGENPLDGIIREITEETGFVVNSLQLFDSESYTRDDGDFIVILGYSAHTNEQVPILSSDEHVEYKWFLPVEALAEIQLPEIHRKFITAWMKKISYSANFF